MVKKTFFIALAAFFLNLTFVYFLAASEFNASVSSTQVYIGENFSLNLTLKEASLKEAPDVSALNTDFLFHGQQQSSNTTIVNGKFSSSITWKLSLSSKKEGTVQIPSLTVNTAEGPLSTQPITLTVIKGARPQSNEDSDGLNIITKANNTSPYKNEPLVYTILISSKLPLYNVQAQKLQVEGAIVELIEQPKLEEKIIDGALRNVIELKYLITPLKTGSLTIPSMVIQGAVPQKSKRQSSSFFHDDFDPFGMMQGFERLKPFTLATEETHVNVQPAIADMSPWIPAQSFSIEEQWPEDQTLRVGEPFSRGFLIKAEGLKASQLPHLEELQSQGSMFKVYADKPEEQEKVLQGVLHSTRKEQYTLIPQQAGMLNLPEISISWWDSAKKEKRVATIPARVVQILPALQSETSVSQDSTSNSAAPTPTQGSASAQAPFLLYSIIAVLAFFLAVALLWGFILQRKIHSLMKDSVQKPVKPPVAKPEKPLVSPKTESQKEKKEKLPDLNPT